MRFPPRAGHFRRKRGMPKAGARASCGERVRLTVPAKSIYRVSADQRCGCHLEAGAPKDYYGCL